MPPLKNCAISGLGSFKGLRNPARQAYDGAMRAKKTQTQA
jgi:hypothetical protein